MTHPTSHVIDYAEGNLPAVEERQLLEHLSSCPACRTDLESIRTVLRTEKSTSTQPSSVSADYFSLLLPRLRQRIGKKSVFGWSVPGPSMSQVLASVAAGVAVLFFLVSLSNDVRTPSDDELDVSSAFEYFSESGYPWSDTENESLVLSEDYFLQNVTAISDLPDGLSDISSVDVSGTLTHLSESQIEFLMSGLNERMPL